MKNKSTITQKMKDIPKKFPILNQPFLLDYDYVKQFEARALKNHNQSIDTLASRGGLSWYEMYCLIEDLDVHSTLHKASSATFYEGYVKRKHKEWLAREQEFVGEDSDIDDPVCEAYMQNMGDR